MPHTLEDTIKNIEKQFDERNPHPGEKPVDMTEMEWVEIVEGYENMKKERAFLTDSIHTILQTVRKEIGGNILFTVTLPSDPQWGHVILEHINRERERMRALLDRSITSIPKEKEI